MILDDQEMPFYWHDNKEHHLNFNLPTGSYYSLVPIKKLHTFKPYGARKYPKLKMSFLSKVRVFPHKNPNKASISLERKFILADNKFFYHDYKPLKTFTLAHEVFHSVYHCKNERERSNRYIHQYYEKKCDEAAKDFMLAHGWNPTQVSLAVKLLLRGQERKDCIRMATTDKHNNFRR